MDHFVVCGLGSLGQHCVTLLREFGGEVSAVEIQLPSSWDLPEVPGLLTHLEIGDCRNTEVLSLAGVRECRAILLVTSDEQVNLEAAFAARLLNPEVRLIVRSSKQNLNQLLEQRLGNFVAFEPTQLSASAFALAALRDETLGFFSLGEQLFQVTEHRVVEGERRFLYRAVHELNGRTTRVLAHLHPQAPSLGTFYEWEPEAEIMEGDTIILIETLRQFSSRAQPQTKPQNIFQKLWMGLRKGLLIQSLKTWWEEDFKQNQVRQVAVISLITLFMLLFVGVVLFDINYPDLNAVEAFYATAILLLGGYSDLLGGFKLDTPIPWWLQLFSFMLTLIGIAFVGVLYALLTEKLLTLKFQFLARRPSIPERDHVIIIGLGRVGQQVAKLLQEFKQPIVALEVNPDPDILPDVPLLTGNINLALTKANLSTARSVVTATEDEMGNLELGLTAHVANPQGGLVIRTYNRRFSDNVAQLFPYAQVLCASALSAQAFATAAYGEEVLGLFQVQNQTVLVTEYTIEQGDTLKGLLLSEVAYGYGVVPIFHQRPREQPTLMPTDDTRLELGDHLVVLATIGALERVERAELAPRLWWVQLEKVFTRDALFEGATEMARITGCSVGLARDLMAILPATLPMPLFYHQALRLVRRLDRLQVQASVQAAKPED